MLPAGWLLGIGTCPINEAGTSWPLLACRVLREVAYMRTALLGWPEVVVGTGLGLVAALPAVHETHRLVAGLDP
jgi:hypothetical protein